MRKPDNGLYELLEEECRAADYEDGDDDVNHAYESRMQSQRTFVADPYAHADGSRECRPVVNDSSQPVADDPIERMIEEVYREFLGEVERDTLGTMRRFVARIRQDYVFVKPMIERQAEALSGGALWWSNWARENGLIIPNPKPSLADKIRTMIAQDGEGAAEKIAKMMEGE